MMFTFCTQIGLMRFLGCVKPTNDGLCPIGANSRSPSFTAFQFRNTKKPASFISNVRLFLVLNIARSSYVAKIIKTIIARVAINMINVVQRLFTSYVKPSKSTSSVSSFVNTNNCISFRLYVPSNSPRNNLSAGFYFPSKNSRFGIVVQKRTQLSMCDFGHAFSIS